MNRLLVGNDLTELAAEMHRAGGRLKARLRPMRGLKTDRGASVVICGHAFMQNIRRGHYEFGAQARTRRLRVAAAFEELAAVL